MENVVLLKYGSLTFTVHKGNVSQCKRELTKSVFLSLSLIRQILIKVNRHIQYVRQYKILVKQEPMTKGFRYPKMRIFFFSYRAKCIVK